MLKVTLKNGNEYELLEDTTVSVSYTHLDVYKRQPLSRGACGLMVRS